MILTKNNQKGSTMMETLGVLTIFLIMSSAAISLVSNLWSLFKQNMVVNEARDLQRAISESYKAEGHYKNLFEKYNEDNDFPMKQLCNEKIAPFQMCSGGKMRHRQGGLVFVSPLPGDESYVHYMVTFTELSKKTCVALSQINWVTQKKTDIYKMTINCSSTDCDNPTVACLPGSKADGSCGEDSLNIYNFSVSDAMSACHKDDGENSIDWVFF